MTTEVPWAGPTGLPTAHAVKAALHVAALLDRRGSAVADARESYWRRATDGLFAPPDLELGQRLLVNCHLVEERERVLYSRGELEQILDGAAEDAVAAICARAAEFASAPMTWGPLLEADSQLGELIPDPGRREEFLRALGRRFDDTLRRLLGAIGEELVVAVARAELVSLGYPELARSVRHLSLQTDEAGYDISAPRVVGGRRLLEVKATTGAGEEVDVHLSRNEAETGLRYPDWSLVLCRVTDLGRREAEIVGWCPARQLVPALPADAERGRWEAAELTLTIDELVPGLPSAVA